MSVFRGLKAFWLARFSQPAGHRLLYRLISKRRPRGIIELGISDPARTLRALSLALAYHRDRDIFYAGIDRFDARQKDAVPLSLKEAHRLLRPTGARINLVPGNPHEALARSANALAKIDLLIVGAGQDADSLARAWFYVPRMLAPDALLLREELVDGQSVLRQFPRLDLDRWAAAANPRRRAA